MLAGEEASVLGDKGAQTTESSCPLSRLTSASAEGSFSGEEIAVDADSALDSFSLTELPRDVVPSECFIFFAGVTGGVAMASKVRFACGVASGAGEGAVEESRASESPLLSLVRRIFGLMTGVTEEVLDELPTLSSRRRFRST